MALEIQIRTAPNIDAKAASELVRVSFNELAASAWEPNARDVFLSESSPEVLGRKSEVVRLRGRGLTLH